MTEKKSFAEMRKELAEKRGRALVDPPFPEKQERKLRLVEHDEDLIPDVLGDVNEDDIQVDGIIAGIDFADAYRRWIGKEMVLSTINKEDGFMVSCPNPGHRDKKPSCWVRQNDRLWKCGPCEDGGDIYDLAAIAFGYPRPDYKTGKMFHDLRREMAESYGYKFKTVSGVDIVWKEEPEPVPPVAAPVDAEHTDAVDTVNNLVTEVSYINDESVDDEPDEEIGYPTIDWKAIVPEDTFMWEYMAACCNDDSPEEYHFFHALIALAHAVGRNVYLDDMKYVYGNMMVCLLGGTGYGKSRSRGWLEKVLEEAVPFRDNGLDTSGCKLVPVPASGENLINQFQHIARDPSLGKAAPEIRTPVNGVVDYDEFAGLLNRAMRPGNTLKVYVQNFADSRARISSSSNTGGTYEAFEPFCSITASTQPKAVRTLLSKYDLGSGFLNRWVFVGGLRKKRESIGGKRSGIHVDLTDAVNELKKVRAWGAIQREVGLTDEGYEVWDAWFHNMIEPLQLADETDLLPRLGLTLKRLLLLFAINDKRTEITDEDVKRIMPLMDYLISCYGILNAEIGISQMSEITNEIMRHIKNIKAKTGRGASSRDLGLRMKRKNYSPDLIDKALKTMVALDWIDVEKSKGTVGRPTTRYDVVS